MDRTPPAIPPRAGFTLTELLIACVLALMVLGAFVTGFIQQQRTFYQKNQQQDLQNNVRSAMDFILRDLRASGSGMVMDSSEIPIWFSSLGSITNIPSITDGGTGPDTLIMAGNAGATVARTGAYLYAGATSIDIVLQTNLLVQYTPARGDVLVLAGIEPVLVESVSGNTLSVTRDPGTSALGIRLDYPANSEIMQLCTITYSIASVSGDPCLLREDSRFTYASTADKVVAVAIEDLQVTRTGNQLAVQLRGRSRDELPGVDDATYADSYLRYTLETDNELRAPDATLNIRNWPYYALVGTPTPVPTATTTPNPTATSLATAVATAVPTATPIISISL